MKSKEDLREEGRSAREALDEKLYQSMSESARLKLFGLQAYQDAKKVCVYIANQGKKELDTHPLVKTLLETKRKEVYVPYIDEDGEMYITQLEKWDDLELGFGGILEPKKEEREKINPATIDIFLVPVVAFDEDRNRIGWGKGHYDKFFARIKDGDGKRYGLAFECQKVEAIPTEKTDVELDKIITNETIYGNKYH